MKKKIRLVNVIFFITIVSALVVFFNNNSEKRMLEKIESTQNKQMASEEDIEVGKKGYISSSVITQRKTGTGPFDSNDEPGNDSSENNNIVRSFDQVTWTIENTMKLKDEVSETWLTGGRIMIKAQVSQNAANLVHWDLGSMLWLEGTGVVSNDGTTLTGSYALNSTDISIPGKQSLVFVLNVDGTPNEIDLQTNFEFYLEGNNDNEKVSLQDTKIITSAITKYNIELMRNDSLYKEIELNENGTTTRGRLYGYSLNYQLYNDSSSKGLKGIEYPDGDINLDVNLKLERALLSNPSEIEDITNEATPMLYNYKLNYYDNTSGYIPNREMNVTWHSAHEYRAPTPIGGGERACYDSGNVLMEQEGSTIHVTVKDYKFNGIFPTKWIGQGGEDQTIRYAQNIGCFSINYFQIFVPYTEESSTGDYNYYLTVNDTNLVSHGISGREERTQVKTNDDLSRIQHVIYVNGSYTEYHWLTDGFGSGYSGGAGLYSVYYQGDARAAIGQKIVTRLDVSAGSNNDIKDTIYDANELMKFDGEAFKVTQIDGLTWRKLDMATNCTRNSDMKFKMIYVAKPDGSNWESDEEMKNAVEEDLLFFNSEEELKASLGENAIIVGVLFESIEGTFGYSSGCGIQLALEITDKAVNGNVYQFVSTSRLYKENNKLDRNVQTRSNSLAVFPEADVTIQRNYVKTAYDENGNIIQGTHNGNYGYGQSLLIVSGKINVSQQVIDKKSDGSTKVNYDIGRNENIATYKIKPQLIQSIENGYKTTDVTVDVIETLPKGLTYIPGSCDHGEPEITNNGDGTQTLNWKIYNCTVGEDVKEIIFSAHIDEESENGTQYTNSVIVSADKIGSSLPSTRTATTSIQITNLSSHRLYKTVETPVIEKNGQIHFKISYKNNTEDSIPAFQLLDILPYNNDGRGTNFHGTYTLDRIDVKRELGQTILQNDELTSYLTSSTDARNLNATDNSIGTDSIWEILNIGQVVNKEVTAFALKGEMQAQEKLTIDIYLNTNENEPLDVYDNNATARIYMETEELQTAIVRARVIKRTLSGKIWFDGNKDGLISGSEDYLENIKVTLVNADGTVAKDINGRDIVSTTTDENGYYYFEDMIKGNYKVIVEQDDPEKEITLKSVGTNVEINSKFNEDSQTDQLTGLNSIDSPEIKLEFVNVGITYKDTKVIVHHYIEGTTAKLSEDVLIEGKVKDEYETSVATDIPAYYELKAVPENKSGEMTLDEIEVIYYYRLKKYPYIVNYLDKDTNEVIHTAKTVPNQTYQTEVQSRNEIINIDKYDYNSADKEVLTIGTDESKNEITLYYTKKKGTVTTKYIDKNTGAEISNEEQTEDKVDKNYTTIKKDITGYTYVEDTGNTEGRYTVEPIEVIYYYKKNTKVTVKYIDKITGQEIPQKNAQTGAEETSREVKNGLVGDTYTSHSKNFDNYVLVESPRSETVTMTPEEIILNYYYIHVSGGVIEKHIDDITGETLENKTHTGNQGDSYNIPAKTFEGYDLVQEKLPNNSQGEMTIDPIEVKYYYKYRSKVTVKYIDIITGEEIPEINEQTGEEEPSREVKEGHEGDHYTTENKTFEGYDLIDVPSNNEGEMTKDEIEVTYYYVHKSAGVVVKYIDIKTGEEIPEVEEETGNTKESQEKIEGHEGDNYITTEKTFEKYDIVEEKYPENAKGKMTIEETEVNYYYIQKTEVEVKYVDIITGEEIPEIDKETGEKKETKETIKGHEGDKYKTEEKVIEGYDLVKEKLPENAEGEMTKEKIEVIYYYKRPAKVIVNYYDVDTNEKIAEEEKIKGHQDDEYKTEAKEIKYYNIVKEKLPENAEGKMVVETIEVNYYYKKKVFNLKVDKTISKIVTNGEEKINKAEIAKVDIHRKKVAQAEVQVVYNINVTNDSELKGKAKLQETIPEGMEMQEENNKGWEIQGSTATIETEEIEPGESVIYVVVLDWINGESSLGMKTNNVEIVSTENESPFKESNIEDNKDTADLIITISTGAKNVVIGIIIALMILIFFTSGIAKKIGIRVRIETK